MAPIAGVWDPRSPVVKHPRLDNQSFGTDNARQRRLPRRKRVEQLYIELVEEGAVRCKTNLVAALAVALLTITPNNVRGSEAQSDEAWSLSETDVVHLPPTFDPLVPEITDIEEPSSGVPIGQIGPS